jgi:hypothetical protein
MKVYRVKADSYTYFVSEDTTNLDRLSLEALVEEQKISDKNAFFENLDIIEVTHDNILKLDLCCIPWFSDQESIRSILNKNNEVKKEEEVIILNGKKYKLIKE